MDNSLNTDDDDIFDINYTRGYCSDTAANEVTRLKFEKKQDIGIEDFEFIKFIGQGAYGKIYLVRKKQTGDFYAMKIIDFAYRVKRYFFLSNFPGSYTPEIHEPEI